MAEPSSALPTGSRHRADSPVVTLPSLGADMDRGTLLQWYVGPGDEIERGSVVALVSTDKADVDVECWQAGTVAELLVELGVEIPVGTPILRLGSAQPVTGPEVEPATVPSSILTPRPAPAERVRPVNEPVEPVPLPPVRAGGVRSVAGAPLLAVRGQGVIAASPFARAIAAEAGIDLGSVAGSGPGGAILARDVESLRRAPTPPVTVTQTVPHEAEPARRQPPQPAQASRPAPAGPGDRATSMRRVIASRMAEANREIPHYYLEHDVDLGPALAWLEGRNANRSVAERVLPAALLLRATAAATGEVPTLNGWWLDDRFEPAGTVDLAVVVALRGGGLVTPKIAGADALTLDELMARLTTVVTAARRGSLRSSWLSGAGLTVSNLGDRGVDRLSGVIFPPQVALVGFGGIRQRPWVVDDRVVPRPVVTVSLAADHRASDGAVGSRFLSLLADHLEHPEGP